MTKIENLFANDIHRRIEEVIKVDQLDEEIIREEIDEYVTTDAIRNHYVRIFDTYLETPNKPHEGIAVWVSGFFGSGKSSFAKMLGFAIENRSIAGKPAGRRFAERTGDPKLDTLLRGINERIPTHAVIFDVSTDRGVRSGNQTLTEIMYRHFLQDLGYARDLDLSELEIGLEGNGQLARFEEEYRRLYDKEWNAEKGKVVFALSEASRVLHNLYPETYPQADSWVRAVKGKADISPGKLAQRAGELMERRKPEQALIFVIDEVGQFVARDVQKMLDLQAIVQSFGVAGRGRYWIVVTSQEKLGELVSGLDDKKIELARLMDRFPLQVHLEPSDISEITSRRVLSKNAAAQKTLGKLFEAHRGRLAENTRLSADIRLPELTREAFIDLYPLLPYQIDLIIQLVSGLRTQGGVSKHVGGANRTIIKLAQQVLINPAVNLAAEPVGALVRLDHVYDLVEGNIASEVRAKITAIAREVEHTMAQKVAKAICLLQYVRSVHRSAENIAATLHPHVAADGQLATVNEALRQLEAAQLVRQGDDGYRIPTPAEDDWERVRNGINPRPADTRRIHSELLVRFWQPQPAFTLHEAKSFKAGLWIEGREVISGDLPFQLYLAEDGKELESLTAELRVRSQQERKSVFWAAGLNDAIDRETVQLFRSREIQARKERETKGAETPMLLAEERQRLRRHTDALSRLLKDACLTGHIYFRGNDRSPDDRAHAVGKTATEVLGQALPEVFERFKEAAAKATEVRRGTEALFSAANLQGLPSVFRGLDLLRDEKGMTIFRVESGPLKEVYDRIEARANYGEIATGRYLADELAKEPFGWEFEVVRLLVLSLLRAGKIEVTSRGQNLDTATGTEAKTTFMDNNLFRSASFRPKKGVEIEEVIAAAEAFRETFGKEVSNLNAGDVAVELRREIVRKEDVLTSVFALLDNHRLPGKDLLEDALEQTKAIRRGTDNAAISTFNAGHRVLKDAYQRACDLEVTLTEPSLQLLDRARHAHSVLWAFLSKEPELPEDLPARAAELKDLLSRESFFRELAAIELQTRALESEYEARFERALDTRISSYSQAYETLMKEPGWSEIAEPEQQRLAEPFLLAMRPADKSTPIPQLRAEAEACESRLRQAVVEMQKQRDGERIVALSLRSYFAGGIETEEQLDAALAGVREECARLIGAGKKVIVQ